MKKALITGITGQDGSYLAELLLEKGYEVHGISRKTTDMIISDISHYECDMMNFKKVSDILNDVMPDEVYHLASSNSIANSFVDPIQSFHNDCVSSIELLEMIRKMPKEMKIFNASSSEIFGNVNGFCDENTILNPNSPYGMSKEYVLRMYNFYREQYGMFISNGILFNHDSPRRGLQYVTRKISSSIAKIVKGQIKSIELGNIETQKDFGYAKDFVNGMWLMLQQDKSDDYVLATGEKHSIREICEIAFSYVGLDWKKHITINSTINRKCDNTLVGDAYKARHNLNWKPSITFKEMIEEMVKNDLNGDKT